jgi:hypothetical protein
VKCVGGMNAGDKGRTSVLTGTKGAARVFSEARQ